MSASTSLGVLGHGTVARIDDRGAITADDLSLDWWVGAGDRWHLPAEELATRQYRSGPAPVVETVVRVPGGDVVQRAYGVTATNGAIVVADIENRSPVPLTVALVVRVGRRGVVEIDDSVLRLDGVPVLVVSRQPGAWAAGTEHASAASIVTGGNARTGPADPLHAPIEVALLFPVPHRTSVRAALGAVSGSVPVDARSLPAAESVTRGWDRQLDRGLQVVVPPPVGELVDAARADLLLANRKDPAVIAALEDWGFDDEAAHGWAGLGWRARRAARRRANDADPWSALRTVDAARDPAGFLSGLRPVLAREAAGAVELLPGFPTDWLGQSLTVDGLPLRRGSLSFAVRWHGARPALLWDAPPGVLLRVPALDAGWSSTAAAGETLLAEPPAPLLPMGSHERSLGRPVDAPGQFS